VNCSISEKFVFCWVIVFYIISFHFILLHVCLIVFPILILNLNLTNSSLCLYLVFVVSVKVFPIYVLYAYSFMCEGNAYGSTQIFTINVYFIYHTIVCMYVHSEANIMLLQCMDHKSRLHFNVRGCYAGVYKMKTLRYVFSTLTFPLT